MNGVIGMSTSCSKPAERRAARIHGNRAQQRRGFLNGAETIFWIFPKSEAGKLEIESLDFEVVNCVKESLELLATRVPQRTRTGIVLSLRCPSVARRSRTFASSPVESGRNAVKFTAQGEVTVSVFRSQSPEMRSRSALKCGHRRRDFKGQIGRLFRPFSQADASTTRRLAAQGSVSP